MAFDFDNLDDPKLVAIRDEFCAISAEIFEMFPDVKASEIRTLWSLIIEKQDEICVRYGINVRDLNDWCCNRLRRSFQK